MDPRSTQCHRQDTRQALTRLLAEYVEEQTQIEADLSKCQTQIDTWKADSLKTDRFLELVERYTDFSELTTPMLNEFVEKVIVHEGVGRGKERRQGWIST